MRLLLTGASGFIGRNLLRSLPRDWRVIAVYHKSADFLQFLKQYVTAQVTPIKIDLTEHGAARDVRSICDDFDACLFLLANSDPAFSVDRPAFDLRANTVSLVELLEYITVHKFVYFSSGAVYDGLQGAVSPKIAVSPRLPYAISKLTSERYLEHFAHTGRVKSLTIVRFFGAYGPFEAERKIYGKLVRQFGIKRDPRFTLRGDGRNLIDAMYVDDAVRAILCLLNSREADGIIDLNSGQPLRLVELVREAGAVFNLEPEITFSGQVPEYIDFFSVDRSMTHRYGFRPQIALTDGLKLFVTYFRDTNPY